MWTFLTFLHGLTWDSRKTLFAEILGWETRLRRGLFEIMLRYWGLVEARLRDSLLLIAGLSSIAALDGAELDPVGLVGLIGGQTWRFAVVEIRVAMRIVGAATATDYFGGISRGIDDSRMRFLYLSGKWIFADIHFIASGIHSAVSGVKAERISGAGSVHISDGIHLTLVVHHEGRLFRHLVPGFRFDSGVLFLSAFVLLKVKGELFSAYWFVADDAVDGIKGSFHVEGEGTVGVGVVGRPGLQVGGVVSYLRPLSGVTGVCWSVNVLILPHGLSRVVGGDGRITGEECGGGGAEAIGRRVGNMLCGGRVDDRYLWSPRERGYGLHVGGHAQSYFSAVKVNVDFKIEGVLTGVGESLAG